MAIPRRCYLFLPQITPGMLQLATLRNNTELVKERLAVKHFKEINLVDDIIALDDQRKKLTFGFDETKAKINAASKEIGQLMSRQKKKQKRKTGSRGF